MNNIQNERIMNTGRNATYIESNTTRFLHNEDNTKERKSILEKTEPRSLANDNK